MGSSSILLLCLLLLFPQALAARFSAAVPRVTGRRSSPNSLLLPLKTQQIPNGFLPHPINGSGSSNKLYFRHNVSLLVSLSIGTPPQNVSMVLDTGSELSWLLCSNTTTKTTTTTASPPSFRPRLSSSYRPIPCSSSTCTAQTRDLPSPAFCDDPSSPLCRVSVSYADGSSSDGLLAADTLRIAPSTPPLRAVFGCMSSAYTSTPSSAPPTTGLLGMNRGSLSLITQMGTRRFSYCISDGDDSPGFLLLGDTPLPFSFNYTPLIQMSLPLPYFDRVAYSVQLEGIRVSTTLLPIPKSVLVPDHTGAGQTMVDSGTQFTFLLGPAYSILKTEFLRQTKGVLTPLGEPDFVFEGAFDLCYRLPLGTQRIPAGVPEVTLVFRGAEVRVSGERLLYRVEGQRRGGDGIWCFTFGNSDLVPMEAYVIGHHHQQNVWVEYDLENGRVGFAPVRCELASQRLAALV